MLTYPNIDPVAIHLGPLQVHWYGLMYLLAFLCAWGLASYRAKQRDGWTSDMVSDLVFYGALGVVLGGRIGYVLFYEFDKFLGKPDLALPSLDRWYELPRRLLRRHDCNAILV